VLLYETPFVIKTQEKSLTNDTRFQNKIRICHQVHDCIKMVITVSVLVTSVSTEQIGDRSVRGNELL